MPEDSGNRPGGRMADLAAGDGIPIAPRPAMQANSPSSARRPWCALRLFKGANHD